MPPARPRAASCGLPLALSVGLPIVLATALAAAGCGEDGAAGGPAGGDAADAAPGDAGGGDAGGDGAADAAGACPAPALDDPAVRATERGSVRGYAVDGARGWLAIPYARPPVGERRWRPPEPDPTCWEGVRDATAWGAACPQIEQGQLQPFSPDNPLRGEEDCLTLNVWAPEAAGPGDARPVLAFVHGGGNTIGSAVEQGANGVRLYEGARFAAQGGVVVVTLQYRLGPLGFLAHPALDAERTDGPAGNDGIRDQVDALRWVQRNIAAFGGDPARVLLFGESAGAVDTCVHLASPRSAGLFSRALMQSGSCLSAPPLAERQAEGALFAERAGCGEAADVAACLRALDVEAVLRAGAVAITVGPSSAEFNWGPGVDGAVLEERPLDAIAAGRHHAVPLGVGSNTDEASLTAPPLATEAAYEALVTSLVGPALAAEILALYPADAWPSPRAAYVQVITDASFTCNARRVARAAVQGQPGVPVYRYLFAQPLEGAGATVAALGAFHGAELSFLFDAINRGRTATAAEQATIDQLVAAWSALAATGEAGAAWPAYGPGEPLLRIAGTSEVVSGWRAEACDFWDRFVVGGAPPAP